MADFHFLNFFSLCDNFSKWRVPKVLQNSDKSSNIVINLGGNEENLAIFTIILMAAFEIILMAAFETKIVHSAVHFFPPF